MNLTALEMKNIVNGGKYFVANKGYIIIDIENNCFVAVLIENNFALNCHITINKAIEEIENY
jgi:hypothetical protein